MAIFGSIRRGSDQPRRRGSSGRRSSQLHYSGVSNAYNSATGSGSRPSRNRNNDTDDPKLYGPGVPLFDKSVRTSSRWIPRHGASGEDAGWGPGQPLAVPPAPEGGHRPLPPARLLPKNPPEGRSTGPPRPIIVFRKKAGGGDRDCGASGLSSLSTGTPCGGAWPDPGLGCIETAERSFGGFYDPSARGGGIERGPSGDTGSSSTGTSTSTSTSTGTSTRTPPNDTTVTTATTAWSSAETILARGAGAGGVVVDVIVNGPKDTSTSSSRVRHMDRIVRILKRLDQRDGVASASKSASASAADARTIASLASREASTHHHVFGDDDDPASAEAAIPPSLVGSSPRRAPSRAGPVSAAKTGSGPGSGSPTSVADPFFDRATGTLGASLSAEAEAPASGSGCHSCLGSPADLSRHFSESLTEIRREVGALCFHRSAAPEPDDSLLLSREDGSEGSGNDNDNGDGGGGDWIEIEAPPRDPPRAPYPYPPVASAAADARAAVAAAVPTTSTDEHYFRRTPTQASI
ncbi:unnamed protein product [Pseudo-nitzschia multistriata]|uniref:Uncharacterized protein n=1 Tax=Pseudo-nitzschia multistriata TaxID=183589 RepID=A0A448Z2J9_9STRA|nr:unnamed protein product [Pseudo-nitzschia multistriata]